MTVCFLLVSTKCSPTRGSLFSCFGHQFPAQWRTAFDVARRASADNLGKVSRVQSVSWSNRTYIFFAEGLSLPHILDDEERTAKCVADLLPVGRTEVNFSQRLFGNPNRHHHGLKLARLQRKVAV